MNFLNSSTDPNKLSLTVKGLLTAILPILITVSGLSQTDATSFVDLITNLVFWSSSLFSGALTLYGLLRKISLGRWSAPLE